MFSTDRQDEYLCPAVLAGSGAQPQRSSLCPGLLWIARAEEPVNGAQSTSIHPGRGVWEPSPLHALLQAAAADTGGTVRPASGPSPAGAAAAQAAFCLAAIYSQLQMLT